MPQSLSLYFHIPFCPQKCRYCSFLSFSAEKKERDQYVEKLIEQIISFAPQTKKYTVKTLYFGGGCPTLLSPLHWVKIKQALRQYYSLTKNIEWTVEIHPATVNEEYLLFLHSLGVNRFSFGIQSFDPYVRSIAGRKGDVQKAKQLISFCHQSKIKNIGLDLIMGLPGQTFEILQKDIDQALQLSPAHLSLYFLSLEKGTPFYKQRKILHLPQDETLALYYDYACRVLRKADFIHYEVSTWAKKGYECEHNKQYWTRGDYRGFGLGAHSFFQGERFCNTKLLPEYMKGKYIQQKSRYVVTSQDAYLEYVLLCLRTKKGIVWDEVRFLFGEDKEKLLRKKMNAEHCKITKKRLVLREKSWILLDAIVQDFVDE